MVHEAFGAWFQRNIYNAANRKFVLNMIDPVSAFVQRILICVTKILTSGG